MKKIIHTENAPAAIGPYSQAIEANGMLFISGQIPLVPETGEMVTGGITEQTDRVLKNIGAILRASGYDYSDVVKTTCLLKDMEYFSDMNEIYGRYFVSDQPARAAFAVAGLPKDSLIEIEVIACKLK